MIKNLLLIPLLLLTTSMNLAWSMSSSQLSLFKKNNISEAAFNLLTPLINDASQLTAYDIDFNETYQLGVIVKVKPKTGRQVLTKLRKALMNRTEGIYLYEDSFGFGDDELVIVPSKDDTQYLKAVRTDGINYNLTAEKVLNRYRAWQEKYKLQLIGAGKDWIEAKVTAEKVDWKLFAKEVAVFCPDVVYQGVGSVAELEQAMQDSKTLYLWWD